VGGGGGVLVRCVGTAEARLGNYRGHVGIRACLRVRAPIGVGSRVIVEWHREQFSAVTRNCRSDGTDFLLGVCREANGKRTSPDPKGVEGTAFSEPSRGGSRNQPDLATRWSLGSVPYSNPIPVSLSAPAWTEKRNSAADPIRCQLSLQRLPRAGRPRPGIVSQRKANEKTLEMPKIDRQARSLVTKGKLCHPKSSFPISGNASRAETRLNNLPLRRFQ
jgi:hypothetical protein